jgi:hypothetical protein
MKIRLSELKQIIKEEVTTASLVGKLNRVDWDYQMSDDPRAFRAGQDEVRSVTTMLKQMDTQSVDAILLDSSLHPYVKDKIEFILGRK